MHPARSNISAVTLAVLCALLLMGARAVRAQTETVLWNFCSVGNCSDGIGPGGLTSDGAGNFYGMTVQGGEYDGGTAFELSPNGSGGWNETVLWNFNGADGVFPTGSLIFDSLGNIYGTTFTGGANGYGVVFELSPTGASWTETVLYNFCSQSGCADGAYPESGVIIDRAGNLYGTTTGLGAGGQGTVFELSPSPGGWTYQVIYNGCCKNDSSFTGLTMDAAGNIFGVGHRAIFELSPNGNGGWNPTVLYSFSIPQQPTSALTLDQAGNLYGAAAGGSEKVGRIYKLSLGESGKWKIKNLYSFKGGTDGSGPVYGGIVFDAAGNIYGTTVAGGEYGDGTVYELAVHKGSYKEKVLWSFNGTDGYQPGDSLILDSAGNLYGATGGGTNDAGVAFEVTP